MTQRDMAGYIGVTPVTLRNWRKEKPKLYEIVMKGFAFEEAVKKAQENADELKALEEKFKIKK
ncbi:helix-turn-helix domain-containing protein [Aliarcobacter cryaerophilus]|uniref:helix-turn-helix domain-containing protein n=1 Tax=Aliarcobacter cryaerophilus TaxID=28198 RepID=UPI0021B5C282|nr:helix-turn-helix domain-containing protein [Aliarcobacter cryaerophilus]MCT7499898.1 helix-turn-helix domain-containing protein [Aliarcobacter cryaerophilus]